MAAPGIPCDFTCLVAFASGFISALLVSGSRIPGLIARIPLVGGSIRKGRSPVQEDPACNPCDEFLDLIDDPVVVTGREDAILFMNSAAKRILGNGAGEASRRIGEMFPPESRRIAREFLADIWDGTEKRLALAVLGKEGEQIPMDMRFYRGSWRGVDALYTVARDMSVHGDERERFRRVFQYSPIPMAIHLLAGGVFVDVNRSFEKFFGYSAEDVKGRGARDLGLFKDPRFRDLILEKIRTEGHAYEIDIDFRDRSGMEHVGLVSSEILEAGDDTTILTAMVDITALKRTEEKLRQAMGEAEKARKNAENATREKSRFLAAMSHEIRTPMTAIIGMTDLALMTDDDREILEYLSIVREASGHLLAIINDILDFSRIEEGMLELRDDVVDLSRTAGAVRDMLESQVAEKGISLSVIIDPGVPTCIKGDAVRLRQVLVNLAGNAIKFTSRGGVEIRMDSFTDEKGEMLRIRVEDSGIGIPPDSLETIFDRFNRGNEETSSRYGGTGLGLSITKQIVNLMGGSIGVESSVGRGSVFTVIIPMRVAGAGREDDAAQGSVSAPSRPMRILVAEDDPVSRRLVVTLLEKMGHDCTAVPDGLEVMKSVEGGSFDCILMDVEMPLLDGLSASRMIRSGRAGERARDIPILAMTAHVLSDFTDQCRQSGMDGVITKPVDLHKFIDAMADLSARVKPRPGVGKNINGGGRG